MEHILRRPAEAHSKSVVAAVGVEAIACCRQVYLEVDSMSIGEEGRKLGVE